MPSTTSSKKRTKSKKTKRKFPVRGHAKIAKIAFISGLALFLAGLAIFFLTFYPALYQETRYAFISPKVPTAIKPVNIDFGIVIPKIQANAKVIDNVDPFNPKIYQVALTKGVAHALGTAYPGQPGNDFIFAHSSVDWYVATRYNSVFYLLHRLEKGDEIDLYYHSKKYRYSVTEKTVVDPADVSYLRRGIKDTSTLTLMTCWPPGTNYKRLIIRAKINLDKTR